MLGMTTGLVFGLGWLACLCRSQASGLAWIDTGAEHCSLLSKDLGWNMDYYLPVGVSPFLDNMGIPPLPGEPSHHLGASRVFTFPTSHLSVPLTFG